MILDLLIVIVVVLALLIGYKWGTLAFLLAEVGFLVVWWIAFSHWPRSFNLLDGGFPLLGLVGLLVVLVISLLVAYFLGRLGWLVAHMPVLQGPDGLLGVFIHPLLAIFILGLLISFLFSMKQVVQVNHQLASAYQNTIDSQLKHSRLTPIVLRIKNRIP